MLISSMLRRLCKPGAQLGVDVVVAEVVVVGERADRVVADHLLEPHAAAGDAAPSGSTSTSASGPSRTDSSAAWSAARSLDPDVERGAFGPAVPLPQRPVDRADDLLDVVAVAGVERQVAERLAVDHCLSRDGVPGRAGAAAAPSRRNSRERTTVPSTCCAAREAAARECQRGCPVAVDVGDLHGIAETAPVGGVTELEHGAGLHARPRRRAGPWSG